MLEDQIGCVRIGGVGKAGLVEPVQIETALAEHHRDTPPTAGKP